MLPNIYKNFYKILGDNDFNDVKKYFDGKKEIVEFLNNIINKYDKSSTFDLVQQTHKEISWINSRKGLGPFEPGIKKWI